MTSRFDAIIAGAGMVGAAIAIGLARQGWKVAIFDREAPDAFDADAAPDLRVSALSLGTERFLNELGVWPDILAMRTCPYQRMAVWEDLRGHTGNLPPPPNRVDFDSTSIGQPHLGHIVENRVTLLALWAAAQRSPNIQFFVPATLRSLSNRDDGVSVTLDCGATLDAAVLIAADGALSPVREATGIGLSMDQYQQQAMVLSVRYVGKQENITWQAFTPSGPHAFLPLPSIQGQAWGSLVWYDHADTIRALKALDSNALLDRVRRTFPAELPPLVAIHEVGSFPLAKRHAQRYFRQRVVLAGDAAHTINPLAGQGVNLGFQDADELIRCLVAINPDGDLAALQRSLAAYERERRPRNQQMIWIMDLFYHLFSSNHLPLRVLRNVGLGVARLLPFGRDKVMRYAMGLEDALPAPLRRWMNR